MIMTSAMLLSFIFAGVPIECTNYPRLKHKGKRMPTFDDSKNDDTGDAHTGRIVETMNLQSQ